jgi:hypothetical protein
MICVVYPAMVQGQDTTDYFQPGFVRFENHIYRPNIKTVVFENLSERLSDPILELGSNQKLVLFFDDLEADFKNYNYTLIHCNADWTPSPLLSNEYLGGFTEDRITNYTSSFNTIQRFTHYRLLIPGAEVRPLISGNYLLKVFVEGYPENPVLTRRMLVVDHKAKIEAHVHRATLVEFQDTRQEIDFSVYYSGLQVANPFEDIKVVLRQNGRWDNSITGLKPLFLKDNELEYSYDVENTFNGGNEFRTFDIRTLRMQTEYVTDIIRAASGYTVVLQPGKSRAFDRYVIDNDIDGKFLVKNQDQNDEHLEGEYTMVKFTLFHDILVNGNFYVFGALSDWRISQENKMIYNYDESVYEAVLYLKQGYYNYEFVFLEDGKQLPDETIVEGSHYETFNTYDILVYYRAIGGRFDRLVGQKRLISR